MAFLRIIERALVAGVAAGVALTIAQWVLATNLAEGWLYDNSGKTKDYVPKVCNEFGVNP